MLYAWLIHLHYHEWGRHDSFICSIIHESHMSKSCLCVCVCVCACVCVCVMFIGISRRQESKSIPSNFVSVKTPGHSRSRRVIVTTETKTVFVARPGSGWMVPTPRSPNVLLTPLYCNVLRHAATHYNTLQHTAAQWNTLQHTATHCNARKRLAHAHHWRGVMYELVASSLVIYLTRMSVIYTWVTPHMSVIYT